MELSSNNGYDDDLARMNPLELEEEERYVHDPSELFVMRDQSLKEELLVHDPLLIMIVESRGKP